VTSATPMRSSRHTRISAPGSWFQFLPAGTGNDDSVSGLLLPANRLGVQAIRWPLAS
jgi:hypothetical protein